MQLNSLQYTKGSRNHKEKRVGRGHGTGFGKTSGRGQDGQKSRKSGQVRLAFEGGQTPLYRRTPKVGFNNINFANKYNVVSLEQLAKLNVKEVSAEFLYESKLAKNPKLPIKVIGNAKLAANTKVSAHKFSKGALEALNNANAKAEILG